MEQQWVVAKKPNKTRNPLNSEIPKVRSAAGFRVGSSWAIKIFSMYSISVLVVCLVGTNILLGYIVDIVQISLFLLSAFICAICDF